MTDDERRMVIRKYPRAFFSNCMHKVLSENGAAGIVLGDNWADAAARIRAEQAAIPETVVAPKERKYPIGGDPKDFCICGHHEMCHADYAGMPRACNQTGCGCRNYQLESVIAPKPTSQQDAEMDCWCDEYGSDLCYQHRVNCKECGQRLPLNLISDEARASLPTPVSGAQEFEEETHKQIESHLAVYGTWRECNCRIHRAIRVGNSDCPGHEFPAVKEGE